MGLSMAPSEHSAFWIPVSPWFRCIDLHVSVDKLSSKLEHHIIPWAAEVDCLWNYAQGLDNYDMKVCLPCPKRHI